MQRNFEPGRFLGEQNKIPFVPSENLMDLPRSAPPASVPRSNAVFDAETYRQGDILIIAAPHATIDRDGEVARSAGRVVLALGESTGHAHAIADHDARLYLTAGADRMLDIGASGATLAHEEHAPILLPPGTYIVRRQREYVPGWAGSRLVSAGGSDSTLVSD